MPKETGIIMSGDHPLKCLDGTKTMTRRTWGLEKINKDPDAWVFVEYAYTEQGYRYIFNNNKTQDTLFVKCPYGDVGDRLWMRETFDFNPDSKQVFYRADSKIQPYGKWRPSIHMYRWASRGLFEILPGLRPERLWDITEADAIAEGCRLIARTIRPYELKPHPHYTGEERPFTHRDHFIGLWDSLNAKRGYGWDGNWWVWRMPYKKLEGLASE